MNTNIYVRSIECNTGLYDGVCKKCQPIKYKRIRSLNDYNSK